MTTLSSAQDASLVPSGWESDAYRQILNEQYKLYNRQVALCTKEILLNHWDTITVGVELDKIPEDEWDRIEKSRAKILKSVSLNPTYAQHSKGFTGFFSILNLFPGSISSVSDLKFSIYGLVEISRFKKFLEELKKDPSVTSQDALAKQRFKQIQTIEAEFKKNAEQGEKLFTEVAKRSIQIMAIWSGLIVSGVFLTLVLATYIPPLVMVSAVAFGAFGCMAARSNWNAQAQDKQLLEFVSPLSLPIRKDKGTGDVGNRRVTFLC
jgi:hypothetical protein